jgi:two-component system, cell cycle sensor histidine kinase and response regulator CckA
VVADRQDDVPGNVRAHTPGERVSEAEQLARVADLAYDYAYLVRFGDALPVLLWASPGYQQHFGDAPPWSRCIAEDRPNVERELGRALAGARVSHEFRERGVDGQLQRIEERLAPGSEPGSVYGCARALGPRDDRSQGELEAQLRQSQKMEAVGRLAGGVAHDFNNLLTVILTHCGFLLTDLPPHTQQHDDASDIQAAARRAAELTQRLLAFSRQQVLTPVALELNTVLRELWPVLRSLVGEDIELAALAQDGTLHVRADRAQLEQILLNLVVNARDAMPSGGKIELSTRLCEHRPRELVEADPTRSFAELCVRDTGIGMSDEVLARIFEPFYTTKEQGKGTGLGLSTVYGIVKQSGGAISVESKVGFGSSFRVVLPSVAPDVPSERHLRPREEHLRGRGTILVVEDEEGVRRGVQRILRHSGYTVLVAADPAQALSLAEDYAAPIDLVLTDVVMPMMSGVELAARLDSLRPGVKVLYMSGHARDSLSSDGDRPGVRGRAIEFLQKPFSRQTLVEKVESVLSAP